MSKSTKWHSRGLMHSIKRTDFIAWSRKKEPKRLPELETRVHCEARFHVSYTKRAKDDESREISNGPTPSAMHRICEKKKRNRCSREVVQSWPWFLMIFALQLGHPRFAVHNSKWSAFIFCSCLSASHEFRFRNLVLYWPHHCHQVYSIPTFSSSGKILFIGGPFQGKVNQTFVGQRSVFCWWFLQNKK